jgi:hypothetical protein
MTRVRALRTFAEAVPEALEGLEAVSPSSPSRASGNVSLTLVVRFV